MGVCRKCVPSDTAADVSLNQHMLSPAPAKTDKSARAIIIEVAELYGLTFDDIKAKSNCRIRARARREAVRKIKAGKDWPVRRIARFLDRNEKTIRQYLAVNEESAGTDYPHNNQYIDLLERHRRLCGVDVGLEIHRVTGAKLWQALFVGVLAETYPRLISGSNLLELYDDACILCGYRPEGTHATEAQLRQFSSQFKKWTAEQGLPDPLEHHRAYMITLSPEFALWLHGQVGRPVTINVAPKE